MIRYILIDIDNTLLDFHKCSDASIRQGFAEFGFPYGPETFPAFITINDRLWGNIEQGKLTREGLKKVRWAMIFAQLGIEGDGEAFEQRYVELLTESCETVDGAEDLLRYLAGKYPVYGASNASYAQQDHRLTLAGLRHYLRDIFASREIGAMKPTPDFFRHCLNKLGNPPKEEVLLIGDSLTADMQGGIDSGIRTCWFNYQGLPHSAAPAVDFIADRLSDISKYI